MPRASPSQQGIQRHVTVRDSRKPRDTENRTFAAELFTRTRRRIESSAVSRRPVFRDRTRSTAFFSAVGARVEGQRGDATASITTRRREEKRHATTYVLASYRTCFHARHATTLPTPRASPGNSVEFRAYSVSSLASASNALSVPGALISETPTGADDEFATSSPSAAAGIVTCGAPAKPEAHVSLSCDARNASTY